MPYWRLFYHFTWGIKLREPLIDPAFEADLHRVIAAKATEVQAVVHAVGGIEDLTYISLFLYRPNSPFPPSLAK
jgi:putative transposase